MSIIDESTLTIEAAYTAYHQYQESFIESPLQNPDNASLCVAPQPHVINVGRHYVPKNFTISDNIKKGGYDDVLSLSDFQRFNVTTYGERELYLFSFWQLQPTETLVNFICNSLPDLELALFEDLLAFGANPEYKDFQRDFPIVCLGSIAEIRAEECVPCIYGRGKKRNLELRTFERLWGGLCHVLLKGVKS